jgi:hypothetical protein
LEGLAVQRGCRHHFNGAEPADAPPSPDQLPNEELAIALLSLALPYSPSTVRCGAAMRGAGGNAPRRLARLAVMERAAAPVRHVAEAGRKFEPDNPFSRELLDAWPPAPPPRPDVLPQPTRFVAMTGFPRQGPGLVLKELLTRGLVKRFLVPTVPSLIDQWQEELADSFSLTTATTNHFTFRADSEKFWRASLGLVASLHTLKQPAHLAGAQTVNWDLLVVEEAHYPRNRDAQAWQAVNARPCQFLLLLTATPVQNSLEALHKLATLLQPGQLPSPKEFRKHGGAQVLTHSGTEGRNLQLAQRLVNFDLLQNLEFAIVTARQRHPELSDYGMQRGFEAALAHYRAQARGREPKPANLTGAEAAAYDLLIHTCEWRLGHRKPGEAEKANPPWAELEPIPLPALIEGLQRLRKSVEFWTREAGPRGYLNFVSQHVR